MMSRRINTKFQSSASACTSLENQQNSKISRSGLTPMVKQMKFSKVSMINTVNRHNVPTVTSFRDKPESSPEYGEPASKGKFIEEVICDIFNLAVICDFIGAIHILRYFEGGGVSRIWGNMTSRGDEG